MHLLLQGDDISDSFVVCQVYLWLSSLAIRYATFFFNVSEVQMSECVCVSMCILWIPGVQVACGSREKAPG